MCLSYTSRLAALAETSTRSHRNQRKRKIQIRAVAESPAEPLGRTSAIPAGGFLDRFRFWTFVGAPPGEIISPRIITISLRVRFVQQVIKTCKFRQLTTKSLCDILFIHRRSGAAEGQKIGFGQMSEGGMSLYRTHVCDIVRSSKRAN